MSEQVNNTFLLSLSVFKKLYDDDKDIYTIISSFIKCELSERTTPFSLFEITDKINEEYNFKIPQAVIKTSLNKIKLEGYIKLNNSEYEIIKSIESTVIKQDSEEAIKEKEYVLTKITEYLDDKSIVFNEIEQSLENYILNKQDKINTHIDACIIKNSCDEKFVNILNEIKYGLVLYEGISYGIENINPKKWNEKTIFLDTEILFYLEGYQGELFQQIADDFLSLINVTNDKKKIITLRFLKTTEKQIDNFFYIAESIIKKKQNYKPNEIVKYILGDCQNCSASDIINKKTDFYQSLSNKGIRIYEKIIDYDAEQNRKYNIESNENNVDDKELEHKKQLSFINILRGLQQFDTLNEVAYLFLTQTNNTINLSMQHKKQYKGFPLALRLFDLTNLLWIKTNQGLGNHSLPVTFDIRNKAKIALSSSLAKSISIEYDKIQNNNQNIDENTIIDQIAELRKIETNPDDITQENCEEIEGLIMDSEKFKQHYEEKNFYKESANKKQKIIQDRESEIEKYKIEINNLRQQRQVGKKKRNKLVSLIILISVLLYFQNEILNTIPFIFFGKVIVYGISFLATISTIFVFFGWDWNKIKSYLKGHE